MPLELNGTVFFAQGEVADALGVSRQTLWRWRQEGRIPSGRRYRGNQVVFSQDEVELIQDYANRLEPLEIDPSQLRLFRGPLQGGKL